MPPIGDIIGDTIPDLIPDLIGDGTPGGSALASALGGPPEIDYNPALARTLGTGGISALQNNTLASPKALDIVQTVEGQRPALGSKNGFDSAEFTIANNDVLYHTADQQYCPGGQTAEVTVWTVVAFSGSGTNQQVIELVNSSVTAGAGLLIYSLGGVITGGVRAGGALRTASVSGELTTQTHLRLIRVTCTASGMGVYVDEGTPATYVGDARPDNALVSVFMGAYANNPPVGNWFGGHVVRAVAAVDRTADQIAAATALLQTEYGL